MGFLGGGSNFLAGSSAYDPAVHTLSNPAFVASTAPALNVAAGANIGGMGRRMVGAPDTSGMPSPITDGFAGSSVVTNPNWVGSPLNPNYIQPTQGTYSPFDPANPAFAVSTGNASVGQVEQVGSFFSQPPTNAVGSANVQGSTILSTIGIGLALFLLL